MTYKTMAAFALGAATAAAIFSTGVQAKLSSALNITPAKPAVVAFATLDCATAMSKLADQGFANVAATDCAGSQFRFNASRKNSSYVVVMDASSGGITTIAR